MSECTHIYNVVATARYKRTRKLAKRRGLDLDLLEWTIDQLARDIPLPPNWRDHQLKGKLRDVRECHIDGAGDWLLLYEKRNTTMTIYLVGTGSHSDLLGY